MRLVGSPLQRGLVRGSFPAPHHHDPNKTLPNFQIWVMVVFPSSNTAGERLRDQRFLRAGVRLRYQRIQTLRRPCYRLLRHRSMLGSEFRQDHRASGPSWPLMAEIGSCQVGGCVRLSWELASPLWKLKPPADNTLCTLLSRTERRVVWTSPKRPDRTSDQCHGHIARSSPITEWAKAPVQAH